MPELLARYQGCLLGLAAGDAVGTTVEFSAKDSFPPVKGMEGGGPFHLQAGQWTDDTSMALCLAESLVTCNGFDAKDQMNRYLNWWKWGYLSSTGHCFDIGMTVASALQKFANDGEPFAGSSNPRTAGNGSLMRLAPVVLWFFPDQAQVLEYAQASSRTTHAAPEALASCRLFAQQLMNALQGKSKQETLTDIAQLPEQENLRHIAEGCYLQKTRAEIFGTGYCVQSLEAALWCFAKGNDFEETILLATNLGDDADTTAAIAGQLAGAFYGVDGIPQTWRDKLWQYEDIDRLARKLLAKSA
ncbi:ADP-ribosylglycohydrolase family protein [Kosakonia sacchari]|uniref:ADP-ribosylglycohydrolase family protein n=1 Tax=Kosakonia sacchari TaxID=1158459 RepID=UPI000BE4D7BE|nr:ADP-ribosylglycohydrolase family protein [Kosakonia sacchari]PDO83474.1 ADP-ribosylglycohydrolase [Kosakonia sacchari]